MKVFFLIDLPLFLLYLLNLQLKNSPTNFLSTPFKTRFSVALIGNCYQKSLL